MDCPACNSPKIEQMGMLGNLLWFRCRGCGLEFNMENNEDKMPDKKTSLSDKIVQWYLEEENLTLEDIDLDNFLELKEFFSLLDACFTAPTSDPLGAYVHNLRFKVTMLEQLIELVEAHE